MLLNNKIELELHQRVRFNLDGNTIFGRISYLCTKQEYHDRVMVYEENVESKFAKTYFPNPDELTVV